jgi:hypothetical protein
MLAVGARVRRERWNMPSMPDHDQVPPEPERSDQPAMEQGGVFGNLPGTRPGVRSPRRGHEKASAAAGAEAADKQSRPAGRRKPSARPSPRDRPSKRPKTPAAAAESQKQPEAPAEHGGVEDLAWAGIAVAAEAATLGVRLLSRAMEAVRKPPDRR